MIKEDWKRPLDVMKLFLEKLVMGWQGDMIPAWHWTEGRGVTGIDYSKLTGGQKLMQKYMAEMASSLSQFWYVSILVLCLGGAIAVRKDGKKMVIINNTYILGYAALLLIMECQSKYKIMIYPQLAIVAGIGLTFFCQILKRIDRV